LFEELYHLLSQLGLGVAARPLGDLIAELAGESMPVKQLQQEIFNVLNLHGRADRVDAVISALVEHGFAGLSRASAAGHSGAGQNQTAGAAARPGFSAVGDSAVLGGPADPIVAAPRASREIHETARGWLDIDGGIYFDVRQHGAGSDSER
jgi:hypothetical protein